MKLSDLFPFRKEVSPSVVIRFERTIQSSASQPGVVHSLQDTLGREWIETCGTGGWAGSTLLGLHTRRYHGLLIAADSPSRRWMLLSRLDETLVNGNKRFELSCNQFPGALHPRGDQYFERFEQAESPQFFYRVGPFLLKKSVLGLHGQNAVILSYELLEGPYACMLELKPFIAGRDIHALVKANDVVDRNATFSKGLLTLPTYPGVPSVYIRLEGSRFVPQPEWYRHFQYGAEQARGFDFEEDLFSHGSLQIGLIVGQPILVAISATPFTEPKNEKLRDTELARRRALGFHGASASAIRQSLFRAADQFIVERDVSSETLIAGYPWFTDWGRDTMIALPGVCLVTKRFDEARSMLRLFKSFAKDGLIPNRFPDGAGSPEYNTVDASLWLFEAVWKFLVASGDREFVVREMVPLLREIVRGYEAGTMFGIRAEPDGLVRAGDLSTQLTWMDAKVHGMPVTPRYGKPIEINALWANALWILSRLSEEAGDADGAEVAKKAFVKTKAAILSQFWDDAGPGFADVLVPDTQDGWVPDRSFRPNQVIALGLTAEIVPQQNARALLERVRKELLTPLGLRTLSTRDPGYASRYEGGPESRDRAYHQGTVWPWLMAPYLKAVARYGSSAELKADGAQYLKALKDHLSFAGLGSVSEIVDGDPPHAPRGCPFQAWSVGAALEGLQILGHLD